MFRRAKVTSVVTDGSYPCKRGWLSVAPLVVSGLFVLGLAVNLFVEKGFHVGVGALALIAVMSSLGIAAQAGIATGTPRRPHPPPSTSHSEHWGWHRLHDFKGPWVWPVVSLLLLSSAVLGAAWLGSE